MEKTNPIKNPLSQVTEFQEGQLILVNKPLEWTSFDVVNKIRIHLNKSLGIKKIKVGHAGTLDPLATGLLILCTGKYTKKISLFQNAEKEYTGTMVLGATRPSYDKETEVDQTFNLEGVKEELVQQAIKQFIGTLKQTPPIYSALKVGGIRAYKKARRQEQVIMEPKNVVVSTFEITDFQLPIVSFRVVCSKGTYIRSLVHDLGKSLNNGAYLDSLCRTRIGDYSIDQAMSLDELLK